jgi:hypothetical protein
MACQRMVAWEVYERQLWIGKIETCLMERVDREEAGARVGAPLQAPTVRVSYDTMII